MKKFLSLVALATAVLSAQDVTGTWQGTLQAGGMNLRTVVTITKDGETLHGTLYSIDQTPQPIPLNPVTLQGTTLKFSVPAIGGTYEGKLDTDKNVITGNVTQNGNSMALTLQRPTPQTAWEIPAAPAPPKPMATNATLEFEVATIKPTPPDFQGRLYTMRGRQFLTLGTTLYNLIEFTYGVHPKQIVVAQSAGADWMSTEKFDVTAQPAAEGQPTQEQIKVMFRKFLAERFQLTFHRDQRELPVYAITVGKNGHKLTKSVGDPNGLPSLLFRGLGNLPVQNASIKDFANVMQSAVLDRPVVDQTGLTGKWDFSLQWTPDEFQFGGLGVRPPAPANTPGAPPDLFNAMQEELGLKLESTKAQTEVLVIDKAAKPSEN